MGTCTNWLTVSRMMFACWDSSKPVHSLPVRQLFLKMLSSMFSCTFYLELKMFLPLDVCRHWERVV